MLVPIITIKCLSDDGPLTMLSSNVQSINLPMDCTAWPFWTMRQSNSCSTPAPRSSVGKQWFEQLAQATKRRHCYVSFAGAEKRRIFSWLRLIVTSKHGVKLKPTEVIHWTTAASWSRHNHACSPQRKRVQCITSSNHDILTFIPFVTCILRGFVF